MKGLENITPHIPSSDKDKTISFLVDVLGFSLENHSEYYSELHSGNPSMVNLNHSTAMRRLIGIMECDRFRWSSLRQKLFYLLVLLFNHNFTSEFFYDSTKK